MKIKRIQVKNIGPYVNENAFDFDVSDITKRMVLIGGKNGAGKTTLFNAIKICLYGCVAYGFESNNAKYFAEIEKIINANEKLKKIGEAEVVIDLLMDDGKYDHTYTFVRSWRVAGKKIAETFTVYKDGETLSETEKSDFESYLLQTLPPNLFRFYFFDGEKISDFVFNSSKNSDFKDAFLKLCSLDTMEIIRENFRRISRSKAKGTLTLSAEYDRCFEADNLIAQRVECAEDEYREISNEILIIDQRLASLEKAYAKGGGISKKEWRSMQDQIAKEDARREGHHKWLKEMANNVLPFIILRTQLEELKSQIALEHKAQVDANVKSTIDTPEIKSIISGVLSRANIELADDISEKVIYEIASYASHTSQITPILNLSDFDRFELTAKINSLLAYDTNRVKEATDDIKASLKCVKRIRKKMERSSIENYDGYLQMKSDLNEQKSKCTQQLLEVDKELQELRAQKAISASKLAKAKSDYEALLKKQSINDISARALLAFDELQKTLYDKSIRLVETGFSQFFASLINKSDLIDGIHIDDSLNVLPYKNKRFKADEMRKIIGKNGVEYLIAQIGLYAYEVLQQKLIAGEAEFELPVEVKQQLSAGEKQIFIMALYQALSQLNKINVPYIVDTPFARIDKEHRGKILNQFFKKLNGQIIILSTDEEIVGEYCESISDIVSNTLFDGTAAGWTASKVRSFAPTLTEADTGEFSITVKFDDRQYKYFLSMNYKDGTVQVETSAPPKGREAGLRLPESIRGIFTPEFVRRFVFDGEQAAKSMDSSSNEADETIRYLYRLDELDEILAANQRILTEIQNAEGKRGTSSSLSNLRTRQSDIDAIRTKLRARCEKLLQEIAVFEVEKVEKEKQRQELDKSYEKLNQEKNDILKEQQKNRGEIDVKITSILGMIKSPYLLSESLCARMFELGNSMKKLKLPKTIAKDFFTELASADRCVCDRCIGERERTAILKRADQYLGSDQQSVLNTIKSSLMDSVYDERLKKAFEELEELRAQANRLDTRFKTNEEKLIKAGGEKARELQERIEELIRLISIARDELERIESKDENDDSLTEENNLHKADQKFKYYEQEIAKATRTNTALRKKELVDSLVNEIKLQATTALKQEIVRKTNEKLRRVIVDDYVEIESIDRYIKLKGRDGASEGQTLSIAYCFLGTLFEDSELEFPFVIDSPTGKMDFEKRQAVADIIPLVFNQMIAFVQSAEVERFADRFYSNPDSQYLTVVASPQDQAVVVHEGIDFFDSYQREHKGDEK